MKYLTLSIAVLLLVPGAASASERERGDVWAPTVRMAFERDCWYRTECWKLRFRNGIFGFRDHQFYRLTSWRKDHEPAWSNDGTHLAFSRCHRDCSIWVRDMAQGRERLLADTPGRDTAPSWAPDDSAIAFQSCPKGPDTANGCDLHIVKVSSGEVTDLTDDATADQDPDWSRVTGRIVFARGDCPMGTRDCAASQIHSVDRRGDVLWRLTDNRKGAWEPQTHPRKRKIVFDISDLDSGGRFMTLRWRRPPRLKKVFWDTAFSPVFINHGRRILFAVYSGDDGALFDMKASREREFKGDAIFGDYLRHPLQPDWRPINRPT